MNNLILKTKCWKPHVGKVNLPFVQTVVARGRVYHRYRRNGQLIRLPDDPTSPEFNNAYNAAHAGFEVEDVIGSNALLPGSIAELVAMFKDSAEFKQLGIRTKELYYPFLDDIQHRYGKFPRKSMTRKIAHAYRDLYAATPGKANNAVKILSRLFSWAVDRDHLNISPVVKIKKLKMGHHRRWSDDEIELFRTVAPPYLKVALALALYTGQRESDIIKMRWNQIKDNMIGVKQLKGGAELWIPIHKELKLLLDGEKKRQFNDTKTISTTILATRSGKPYGRGWFVNEWIQNKYAAGLPDDCVFHGLRATASSRLAEAGCTDEEIQAITGHKTKRMVEHYTQDANQKIMARSAIKKFEKNKKH